MRTRALLPLALLAVAAPVGAQTEAAIRDEMLGHFEQSSAKFVMLAEAMPGSLYEWAPAEGVMEVGHVYMHVARYNFMYLEDNLGIPAPQDVDLDALEGIRDKARVQALLQRSIEHVRSAVGALPAADVGRTTELYGRDVPGWAVLVQLVAHMNEHLGQSIAYARMNGVVPPWSG
ncbi:MAG: DinB family protein [Gemmatimonadota bacterium]|nr:DinB family protein [Gemmatimonadota bacterium]